MSVTPPLHVSLIDRALAWLLLGLGIPVCVGGLLLLLPAPKGSPLHAPVAAALPVLIMGAVAVGVGITFHRRLPARWFLLGTAAPVIAALLYFLRA